MYSKNEYRKTILISLALTLEMVSQHTFSDIQFILFSGYFQLILVFLHFNINKYLYLLAKYTYLEFLSHFTISFFSSTHVYKVLTFL